MLNEHSFTLIFFITGTILHLFIPLGLINTAYMYRVSKRDLKAYTEKFHLFLPMLPYHESKALLNNPTAGFFSLPRYLIRCFRIISHYRDEAALYTVYSEDQVKYCTKISNINSILSVSFLSIFIITILLIVINETVFNHVKLFDFNKSDLTIYLSIIACLISGVLMLASYKLIQFFGNKLYLPNKQRFHEVILKLKPFLKPHIQKRPLIPGVLASSKNGNFTILFFRYLHYCRNKLNIKNLFLPEEWREIRKILFLMKFMMFITIVFIISASPFIIIFLNHFL